MKKINNSIDYFFILLICVFGYFIYLVYENFLFNIMISLLLVIGTLSLYDKVFAYLGSKFLTSILLSLVVGAFFLFPMFYFTKYLAENLLSMNIETLSNIINNIKLLIEEKIIYFDIDISQYASMIDSEKLSLQVLDIGKKLGQIGVSFVTDISLVVVFYLIILIYKDNFDFYFRKIIPLDRDQEDEIMGSLSSTMSIVFNSTILVAFLEGLLFAIIMYYYGYNVFLFGLLYGFASLIPVIGGLLVWVPIVLYELSIGNSYTAIIIAIYTIVVISIVADTFVKPIIIKIIKKNADTSMSYDIHEYIIFFAILAGMTSFGFWGIVIGPAVTTIFLTLLYIYSRKQI